MQKKHQFKAKVTSQIGGDFLLYLPSGYARSRSKYPLLLFLHGAGERGDDIKQVKLHGPPKEIENGREFPFIVVSPQCPAYCTWNEHMLTGLLDHIESKYRVDKRRVYVTGLSMGGFGAYRLLAQPPKRFAAAVIICGAADLRLAPKLKGVPIWAFHGTEDRSVLFEEGKKIADAAKKEGAKIKFTPITGGQHNIWTDLYAGAEIYEWLMQHRLSTSSR